MLPVTDAMVLGTKVDAVVVVARARLASRPHLVALRPRARRVRRTRGSASSSSGGAPDESQEYGGYLGGTPEPRRTGHAARIPATRETELL